MYIVHLYIELLNESKIKARKVELNTLLFLGVGKDGLLHVSKMKGRKVELGNRVEVKLLSKDVQRGKISLELVRML